MAGKTKYLAKTSMALADGTRARRGEIVELDDKTAKLLHKSGAIGLYISDGEEAPDDLPKPKPKKRQGKPSAPTPLSDTQTLTPDPKAR